MLDSIRKNVHHPYIKILLGLIILVFALFFGWGMRGSQQKTYVAKVDDIEIGDREYSQSYRGMLQVYEQIFRDELTPERIEQLGLGRRALEMLIDQKVLLIAANDMGLDVSDEELRTAISAQEAFHRDGVFNPEVYQQMLATNRLSTAEYEQSKRIEILLGKVENIIKSKASVSDEEVEAEYRERETKLIVDYAGFSPEGFFSAVETDEAKLAEYFEAEKETFRTPEKRSARYVYFPRDGFVEEAAMTEEEVSSEYRIRSGQFIEPEAVSASHILFMVPEGGDPMEEEVKLEEARIVLDELLNGGDFAELAAKHSEDPGSKDLGGALGWFERGRMVPEFEAAAFTQPLGEVGEIVRSQFGYHIIMVTDKREERQRTLDEVRDEITLFLKNQKSHEAAYTTADNLLMDLEDGETGWDKLENVVVTDSVVAGQKLEKEKDGMGLSAAIFAMSADSPGELLETIDGVYLVSVSSVTPSELPEFDAVKAEVEEAYRKVEAERTAEASAKTLAGIDNDEWAAAINKANGTAGQSKPFTKKDSNVEGIGWAPEVVEAAAKLEVGEITAAPIRVKETFYMVKLANVEEAKLDLLPGKLEAIRAELLPAKQDEILTAELEALKAKIEIDINEDAIR